MLLVFSFKEYMWWRLAIKREHASLSCYLPIILNEYLNGHAQIVVQLVEKLNSYENKVQKPLRLGFTKIFILYAVVAQQNVFVVRVLFYPAVPEINKSSWATDRGRGGQTQSRVT